MTPSIDFDLRQLEVFRKVVELGSFSKAADAVCLAQASVSERIATLESVVGTKLLDRLGRQVVPTKVGEFLYKHAVTLLEMKRGACLELENLLGLKQGEIHIGGSTIPGEYILPKVVGRFRQTYPFVSVKLTIADTGGIERRVLEGQIELGVVGSRSTESNVASQELWRDELVLAIPANHPLAKRRTVSAHELPKEPFILREVGSGTLKIMEDYLRRSPLKGIEALNVVARFSSSTAVKEGIKAGLGISILSSRALETELGTGILKTVKIKDLSMTRSFYLVRDRRRIASPLCQAMLDFLLSTRQNNALTEKPHSLPQN